MSVLFAMCSTEERLEGAVSDYICKTMGVRTGYTSIDGIGIEI